MGEGSAGVKWRSALADMPCRQSVASARRSAACEHTDGLFSWGLFFRAAKKIAILTRRLF
ncbi:hypothetical protein MPLSOD_120100 [Mesorhizobium sp. SOD10]|nr:hypothetical protein MPLSOD_120100 [Mesorhizobium sp. SOD10]